MDKFNPSDANHITRKYLDSILIEERLMDSDIASTEFELFGEKFSSPIMTPSFSHLETFGPGRQNGMCEYSLGAKMAGVVNWVGMGENEDFAEIMKAGAKTIKVIKPYADRNKLYDQMAFSEKAGAFGLGVDIDHSFSSKGGYDVVRGEKMKPLSSEEIKELVKSTKLPFIIKGVLSVRDAVACAECGVAGILVSHHHGRLPYAVPPLMVLPDIKAAVGDKMKIFVDCSIDTGADAYKALALGADAVAVGRALMEPIVKGGPEGARDYLKKMNEELAFIMAFTGCRTLKDIEASALWINGKQCK